MTWTKTLEDYEVSDDGRIRNIHNKREIKQFVGKDGYLRNSFINSGFSEKQAFMMVLQIIGASHPKN